MTSRVGRIELGLPILLETPYEMVVVKPSGTATQLTRDPKGASLLSRVRAALPRDIEPRLPHRLDRVSRGLVVVALTKQAIAYHNEQIRSRAWDKLYVARCLAPQKDDLDSLLGVHKLHLRAIAGRSRVVRSGGQQALTEILSVAPAPSVDGEIHVLLKLLTGRFHQIRASLAHLGTPLVDDWIYGHSPGRGKERFYLEHVALRFRLLDDETPCVVHWADDPHREGMDHSILETLDAQLAAWENEGARRVGGKHA